MGSKENCCDGRSEIGSSPPCLMMEMDLILKISCILNIPQTVSDVNHNNCIINKHSNGYITNKWVNRYFNDTDYVLSAN